jgi:hypothetical protein
MLLCCEETIGTVEPLRAREWNQARRGYEPSKYGIHGGCYTGCRHRKALGAHCSSFERTRSWTERHGREIQGKKTQRRLSSLLSVATFVVGSRSRRLNDSLQFGHLDEVRTCRETERHSIYPITLYLGPTKTI